MTRSAFRLVGLAIAAATMVPAVQSAGAKELIFNSYLPQRSSLYQGAIAAMEKRLAKESKGALTIKVPPASLGPQWKQWQLVTSGVADIAIVPNHSQRQRLVLPNVATLPLTIKTSESASAALWEMQQKHFAKFNEYKGAKLFGFCIISGRQLVNNKRPLNSVDDIEGLKMWSGLVQKEAIQALGAVDVSVPFPKVFEVVSKGTVDGMIGSPSTLLSTRTAKYMKYMTDIPGGIGTAAFSLVMNQSSWNSLSSDEKAAFDRAASGISKSCGKTLDSFEKRAEGVVTKKMGVTITKTSPQFVAQLAKILAPLKTEWLEGAKKRGLADPEAVYKEYLAEMNRMAQ